MSRAYERLGKVKFQQKLYGEAIAALERVEEGFLSENAAKMLAEAEACRDEEIKKKEAERREQEARELEQERQREEQRRAKEEQANTEKHVAGMAQLLDKMRQLKGEGNSFFKHESYGSAMNSYKECLTTFEALDLLVLEPSQVEESTNLQSICRLNIAACCIKSQSSYNDAVAMCNLVLQRDPNNVKAIYRRSQV